MVFSDSNIALQWSQGMDWTWHLYSQTKVCMLSSKSCATQKMFRLSDLSVLVTQTDIMPQSWGFEMVQWWGEGGKFLCKLFPCFYSLTASHVNIIDTHYPLCSSKQVLSYFLSPTRLCICANVCVSWGGVCLIKFNENCLHGWEHYWQVSNNGHTTAEHDSPSPAAINYEYLLPCPWWNVHRSSLLCR